MLEVPAWLIELAARDDPPTTIGPDLVARLQTAGVEALEPAGGLKGLPEDEAGQADGIGAVVPGVSVVSSFEPGRAPVAAALADLVVHLERFDRLRRLRLAAIDMDLVEGTARALRDRTGPARLFERVLESGLLTVYARPYLGSNRTGGVANIKGRWEPTGDDAELHRRLIDDLRGGYHAHAERSRYRTLTDTAALLDLEGPPTYAEAWWRLTDEELDEIADLAARQATRFRDEANRLGAELGEKHDEADEPRGRWDPNTAAWLERE